MGKENLKKENLLLRIFKGIKKGWERLGQEDVVTEDSFIGDRNINEQVAKLEEFQAKVHNQRGAVSNNEFNAYKTPAYNQEGIVQGAQVNEYEALDNARAKDNKVITNGRVIEER